MTTSTTSAEVADDPEPEQESARGVWEAILGLPLWIAFVAGFAALIKVMTVADYSLNTTLVIVTTSPHDVLLGAVTADAYLLIGMAAFGVLYTGLRLGAFNRGSPLTTTLTVLAFLLCALEIPWRYCLTGLVLFLAASALSVLRRRSSTTGQRVGVHALATTAGVALVWLILPTVRTPWLPAELLVVDQPVVVAQDTREDPDPETASRFVGYVISSTPDGWTTVLTSKHRFVTRVPSEAIKSRYMCVIKGNSLTGERAIYQWLQGEQYDGPNGYCPKVTERVDDAQIPVRQR